jgi:hypothetical protein
MPGILTELTAAGTVQVLHLIPFSFQCSCPEHENRNRCKCKKFFEFLLVVFFLWVFVGCVSWMRFLDVFLGCFSWMFFLDAFLGCFSCCVVLCAFTLCFYFVLGFVLLLCASTSRRMLIQCKRAEAFASALFVF